MCDPSSVSSSLDAEEATPTPQWFHRIKLEMEATRCCHRHRITVRPHLAVNQIYVSIFGAKITQRHVYFGFVRPKKRMNGSGLN